MNPLSPTFLLKRLPIPANFPVRDLGSAFFCLRLLVYFLLFNDVVVCLLVVGNNNVFDQWTLLRRRRGRNDIFAWFRNRLLRNPVVKRQRRLLRSAGPSGGRHCIVLVFV